MSKHLVIVESPAKAKTIKKYLGKDFEVMASYGHVRDLVPKGGAVDPENGFAMKYALIDKNAKVGQIGLRLGLGWAKSHSFATGQCPVKKYNRQLMNLILNDKTQIAKAVNATTITLDQVPESYREFDQGAAKKYVIDPHGMTA